jgi:hypothetical protein
VPRSALSGARPGHATAPAQHNHHVLSQTIAHLSPACHLIPGGRRQSQAAGARNHHKGAGADTSPGSQLHSRRSSNHPMLGYYLKGDTHPHDPLEVRPCACRPSTRADSPEAPHRADRSRNVTLAARFPVPLHALVREFDHACSLLSSSAALALGQEEKVIFYI